MVVTVVVDAVAVVVVVVVVEVVVEVVVAVVVAGVVVDVVVDAVLTVRSIGSATGALAATCHPRRKQPPCNQQHPRKSRGS